MNLYTNTKSRGDFFLNIFSEYTQTPCQVLIAVAFLTDAEPVLQLVRRGCRVRLIVRLGYPTSPVALRKLLGHNGIQVRYINNHSFHPKLYLFEERCAIVGSANLTQSALTSNQEIGVAIQTDDPRYEELVWLFAQYWAQVRVLEANSDVLQAYERLYNKYSAVRRDLDKFEKETADLAETRIDNIERGDRKADAQDVFLEGYRATYQEFLDAFRTVEKIYRSCGSRKVPDEVLPLRLEIDSFLSWVRDTCGRRRASVVLSGR
jgi:phosphatidylserine/phosphatidylglycerophosphate/cardiolipin synthase-like enzyme